MAMGAKPDVWAAAEFKTETNPNKPRKKFQQIDTILRKWDGAKDGRSTEQRVNILRELIAACMAYIQAQQKKKGKKEKKSYGGPSSRLLNRIAKTGTLAQQAFARLAFEQHQYMKGTRGGQGILGRATRQALQDGYSWERTSFVRMKGGSALKGTTTAINPGSGSYLEDLVGNASNVAWRTQMAKSTNEGGMSLQIPQDALAILANKTFATLSETEMNRLYQVFRSAGGGNPSGHLEHVHYARLDERLRDLVLIAVLDADGTTKLFGTDGKLFDTGTSLGFDDQAKPIRIPRYWAWAMGPYGNLYCKSFQSHNEQQAFFADATPKRGFRRTFVATGTLTAGPLAQYNHSSFMAGREVVCAGEICIQKGLIYGINNSSGHYRPNAQKLSNALQVCKDEHDLDVNETIELITEMGTGGSWQAPDSVDAFQAAHPPE